MISKINEVIDNVLEDMYPKTPQPVTANSVLYKDDFEKEIKYKHDVYRFGSISKHFMEAQIKNHINVLHEVALRYDRDYDYSSNSSYGKAEVSK